MSKKHFIALADALRELRQSPALEADMHNALPVTSYIGRTVATGTVLAHVTRRIADVCKADNPKFDRDLFIAYVNGECGPNGGAIKGRGKV